MAQLTRVNPTGAQADLDRRWTFDRPAQPPNGPGEQPGPLNFQLWPALAVADHVFCDLAGQAEWPRHVIKTPQ
jgi:hypothetical protein